MFPVILLQIIKQFVYNSDGSVDSNSQSGLCGVSEIYSVKLQAGVSPQIKVSAVETLDIPLVETSVPVCPVNPGPTVWS